MNVFSITFGVFNSGYILESSVNFQVGRESEIPSVEWGRCAVGPQVTDVSSYT